MSQIFKNNPNWGPRHTWPRLPCGYFTRLFVTLLQVFAELGQDVVQTGEEVVAEDAGVTDPENADVELPLLGAVPGMQPTTVISFMAWLF
jgi:hypothetical protein